MNNEAKIVINGQAFSYAVDNGNLDGFCGVPIQTTQMLCCSPTVKRLPDKGRVVGKNPASMAPSP